MGCAASKPDLISDPAAVEESAVLWSEMQHAQFTDYAGASLSLSGLHWGHEIASTCSVWGSQVLLKTCTNPVAVRPRACWLCRSQGTCPARASSLLQASSRLRLELEKTLTPSHSPGRSLSYAAQTVHTRTEVATA